MQIVHGSLLAHPRMVAWRNRFRHNRLLRRVYGFWAGQSGYEERFGRGLLAAVMPGDVVWDIGANVGFYSAQFLQRQARKVVCFEPAPDAVKALEGKFGRGTSRANQVHIVPAALSNARGTAKFIADGSAPVNKIAEGSGPGAGATIDVKVLRGDEALSEYQLPPPDIIKVDVEGYELEVIEGLAGVLALPGVRAVFVEVHFALLHERGLDVAPTRIVEILESRGFRLTWLDPSHLWGTRPLASGRGG
jgi:FkbM family methyltransferase